MLAVLSMYVHVAEGFADFSNFGTTQSVNHTRHNGSSAYPLFTKGKNLVFVLKKVFSMTVMVCGRTLLGVCLFVCLQMHDPYLL